MSNEGGVGGSCDLILDLATVDDFFLESSSVIDLGPVHIQQHQQPLQLASTTGVSLSSSSSSLQHLQQQQQQHHGGGHQSMIALPPLHGNGLNLSTNHGLDLTCPHYEGLNLSLTTTNVYPQQQHQVIRQRPQQQQHQPQQQGLNLSHTANGHQFNRANPARSSLGHHQGVTVGGKNGPGCRQQSGLVGLNLSIQSAGINLSRQASSQTVGSSQGGSTFIPPGSSVTNISTAVTAAPNVGQQTSYSHHQQQQYYYTTHTSGGYINLSTQKLPPPYVGQSSSVSASTGTTQNNYETHRQSPLNLEHRSSPLNLTSPVVPNSNHDTSSSSNNNNSVPVPINGNVSSQFYDNGFAGNGQFTTYHATTQNSGGKNANNYVFDVYDQSQPEGQEQQTTMYGTFYNAPATATTVDYQQPVTTTSQQQQLEQDQQLQQQPSMPSNACQFSCQNGILPMVPPTSSSAASVPMINSRIRLFCSSCCQEFDSSADLNKHMEQHNSNSSNLMCDSNLLGSQQQQIDKDAWDASVVGSSNNFVVNNDAVLNDDSFSVVQMVCEGNLVPDVSTFVDTVVTSSVVMATTDNAAKPLPAEMSNFITADTNNSSKKTDDPVESCLQCSMTFASGVDLKKHIDLAHNGRQGAFTYQCRICGQEFAEKSEHRSHMEAHSKDKPFQCQICGQRLSNQTGLNKHAKRVHERRQPFNCKECGRRFYEKHDLQRHVRRAHEKVSQVPKCDVCGKGFPNVYNREKHKCKGPEGKFPCEICDCKLDSKAGWGIHMWKHTKDPKYIDIDVNPVIQEKSRQAPSSSSTLSTTTAAPPEAHAANNNARSSHEPICLQKSGPGIGLAGPSLKPLNMAAASNVIVH